MVCCGDSDDDDEKDMREGNFRRDRCGEVENGNDTLGLCHRCARGGCRCRNAETHNVDGADNAVGGRHSKFRGHTAELKIMILDVVVIIVLVMVMVDDITKNKNKNNDDDDENNGTMVLILAMSRWRTN